MIKKFFTAIFIIVNFSQFAYAIQCPSISDWSHIKGQEWQLSDAAKAQGWQAITEPAAIDSDLTQLPVDKYLLVGVSTTGMRFTSCGYSLQKGDEDNVIVALNTQDRVDIKKLQPPFNCRPSRCFCETTAGQTGICTWEWISKMVNLASG